MKLNKYVLSLCAFIFYHVSFAQLYRYEGYIEQGLRNKTPITLKLNIQTNQITGSYYYTKGGELLNLEGTILPNKHYELRETNSKGSVTGYFTGIWEGGKEVLEGKWLTADRKTVRPTAWKKVPNIQYNLVIKSEEKKQQGSDWHRGEKSYIIFFMKDHPDPKVQENFNKRMGELNVDMNIGKEEIQNNIYISNEVKIICATDEFISYEIIRKSAGEGQGNKELHSFFTFDIKKAEEIHLKDIFNEKTDPQKWLEPLASRWEKDTHVENMSEGKWHLVLIQNSLQMFFTSNDPILNFDELQFIPITIPYSEISNLINPESSLGRWLKVK
jgi:hypothetical protein